MNSHLPETFYQLLLALATSVRTSDCNLYLRPAMQMGKVCSNLRGDKYLPPERENTTDQKNKANCRESS